MALPRAACAVDLLEDGFWPRMADRPADSLTNSEQIDCPSSAPYYQGFITLLKDMIDTTISHYRIVEKLDGF